MLGATRHLFGPSGAADAPGAFSFRYRTSSVRINCTTSGNPHSSPGFGGRRHHIATVDSGIAMKGDGDENVV
jgi:hypothetical protein